jgi:serine protease Do
MPEGAAGTEWKITRRKPMRCTRLIPLVLALGLTWTGAVSAETSKDILHQISDAQAALYDQVGPSVVRIITSRAHSAADAMKDMPMLPFMNPELWEGTPYEFFFQTPDGEKKRIPFHGRQKPGTEDQGEAAPGKPQFHVNGVGSGIVVRADESGAWLVTNNHVIGDAERIDIEFRDENSVTDFDLISDPSDSKRNTYADPKSDLAVIRLSREAIGARTLKPAKFGDSDSLRVGQLVFTLGAPLNREQTFSQGIISAKDRSGVLPGASEEQIRYEGFLQTTAFINVGNSGGPLINVDGEVVGIDVAIQTAGGLSNGFIGIGFAIPSNRAKSVVDSLIEKGKVVRGWLGVQISPTDLDATEYFNLPPKTGVKVREVFPDTPADKGGLKKNDIILSFEGKPVQGTTHLQDLVASAPLNRPAKLEVIRGGEKVALDVPIEEQPEEPVKMVSRAEGEIQELGATLRDPDEEEAKYYGDSNFKGVIVADVKEGGALDRASVKIPKGSLITAIEHTKVTSVNQVREIIEKIVKERGSKRELRVMVTYVPNATEKAEEFGIVKLDLESK